MSLAPDGGGAPEIPFDRLARYGTPRLVAHIRDRYHEVHRHELADALALTERLEPAPELTDLLRRMSALVEAHQRKEEAAIFPAMLRGGWRALRLPLMQMAAEHLELERMTAELDRLVEGFDGPGACVRRKLLSTLCRKIVADLREHGRLEDEILFPRFRQFASAQRRASDDGLMSPHGADVPRLSHQG